ncbi:MFS transporter [Amycolatopsis alba]|uniref:MFS transporter n=1 Tax=Amycolatopsis alba DSM 44262 TaxID=1125972 RepID=A0A229S8W1_AMYAL|nr:MFS transporter [Amycolatopsis alba]OXM55191.1 MFS transporter [Amycolatopsis alba DSM 44262]
MTQETARPAPAGASASPPGARGVYVALVLAAILGQMSGAMPTAALGDIAVRLEAPASSVGFAHSLCFLLGGLVAVVVASYGDYSSRRRLLIGSLVVTCAGLALAAVTPNVEVLMVARVLQSASGAAFPLALRVLWETMPPERFGRAMGVITAAYGGVAGIDSLIGGWLTDHGGFRAVFGFMTAFGALALYAAFRSVPRSEPSRDGKMDWWGAAVLCLSLASIQAAAGMADGPVRWLLLFAGLGVALFLVFVRIEARRENALIPARYLLSRRIWPMLLTSVLLLTGVLSVINYTVPLLAIFPAGGYGHSATMMTLLFMVPPCAVTVLASPLAGALAPRVGWLRILRLSLSGVPPLIVAIALAHRSQWVVLGLVILLAAVNSVALTALNGLSVVLAPPGKAGVLPGINSACLGLGGSIGIALASQLSGRMPSPGDSPTAGFAAALWMAAIATALALVVSFAVRD